MQMPKPSRNHENPMPHLFVTALCQNGTVGASHAVELGFVWLGGDGWTPGGMIHGSDQKNQR